ncbi:MAG: PAS domain-containing protein [Cyclobacteriaceae bacterium]|nr:PAS domain-containing protein [Cyclobacteriaceae bacterium]
MNSPNIIPEIQEPVIAFDAGLNFIGANSSAKSYKQFLKWSSLPVCIDQKFTHYDFNRFRGNCVEGVHLLKPVKSYENDSDLWPEITIIGLVQSGLSYYLLFPGEKVFALLFPSLDAPTYQGLSEQEIFQNFYSQNARFFLVGADKDFQICYVGNSCENITGLSQGDYLNKTFFINAFVYEEDIERVEDLIKQKLHSKEKKFTLRHRTSQKNGNQIWVESDFYCFYDENAQYENSYIGIYDISYLMHNEHKLEKIMDRFELAVDVASTGVWEMDLINEHFMPDASLLKLLKVQKPQQQVSVEGYWENWIHPDDRNVLIQYITEKIEHGEENIEHVFRMITADGNDMWVLTRGRILYRKHIAVKMICASTCINSSVEINNKLRKALSDLEHIVASMPDLIFRFNKACDFLEVGGNALSDLPIPSYEIIGKNLKDVFPKGAYETLSYTIKRAGEKGGTETCEYKLKIRGEEQFFETRVVFISQDECIAIVRNITDEIRVQHELLKARKLAEETLLAKEEFLATMSHEVRTPINSIVGMVNLMMNSQSDKEKEEYLQSLKFSSEHLLSLVNDVLDYTKIKSNKLELEKIEFNLHELLHNLQRNYRYLLESKNLDFRFHIEPMTPKWVFGDPNRLMQILNNLLSNAGKFTRKGFVSLSVGNIEKESRNTWLYFTVQDSGIGIEPENYDKIFQPYQQGLADISRKYGGTGLGLTIVKQLAELQGGNIQLKSRSGEGSSFTCIIPFADVKTLEEEHLQDGGKSREKLGLNILYADDLSSNLMIMRGHLNQFGCEMDMVYNGEDALEKVKAHNYDVVMLDLQMPYLDGYQTMQAISEMKKTGKISSALPVFAVTAEVNASIKVKTEDAGFSAIIVKPIQPDDLYFKLTKYFEGGEEPTAAPHSSRAGKELQTNTDGVKKLRSIDFSTSDRLYNDSPESYLKLLNMLKSEYEEYRFLLRKAIQEDDVELFSSIRHKMLSNMKLFQMEKLITLLLEIKEHCICTDIFQYKMEYSKKMMRVFDEILLGMQQRITQLLLEKEFF